MIEDEGAGFPAHFDPCKDGVGLGMRMITSLVQAHSGKIAIGAEPEEYALAPSRVAVRFPL
jgi:nitrogen-specific signal transduction histidine kinase